MLRTSCAIRVKCHLAPTNQSSNYRKCHTLSILSHHSLTVMIWNPLNRLCHLAGLPGGVIRSCNTLVRMNTVWIYNNKQPTKQPIVRPVTQSYALGCQIIGLACVCSKIKQPQLAWPVGNTYHSSSLLPYRRHMRCGRVQMISSVPSSSVVSPQCSPSEHYHSLNVHLETHSIMAWKGISKVTQLQCSEMLEHSRNPKISCRSRAVLTREA